MPSSCSPLTTTSIWIKPWCQLYYCCFVLQWLWGLPKEPCSSFLQSVDVLPERALQPWSLLQQPQGAAFLQRLYRYDKLKFSFKSKESNLIFGNPVPSVVSATWRIITYCWEKLEYNHRLGMILVLNQMQLVSCCKYCNSTICSICKVVLSYLYTNTKMYRWRISLTLLISMRISNDIILQIMLS